MSGIKEWFLDLLGQRTDIDGNVTNLLDEKIEQIYSKELAIASCINMIANAVSECEIKTFENGKSVKGQHYYELNYEPNLNQNGSQLWHRAIEKMFYENEAIIVTVAGQLHLAESYETVGMPIKGNIYRSVVIGTDDGQRLQLERIFNSNEVIKLKLSDLKIKRMIDSLATDYDELLTLARKNYKDLNSIKYKLIIDAMKYDGKNFQEIFQKKVLSQLSSYINNPNGIYIQYKGYELERQDPGQKAECNDFIELRKELFYIVAQAFNIPASMVIGDTTRNQNINDLITSFLTFCIDPIADMIQKELTRKIYGSNGFTKGNYIYVNTNTIKHIDVLDSADKSEKLISSSSLNRNELREILGYPPVNDEYGDTFFMTKNYSTIDTVANEVTNIVNEKGGDNIEEDETNADDEV